MITVPLRLAPGREPEPVEVATFQPVEQLDQWDVEGGAEREEPVEADLAGARLPAAEGAAADAQLGGKVGLGPPTPDAFGRDVPRQERGQRLRHADIVERTATDPTPPGE
jgi:hypothetical protein